jgi:hypothetical protein
MSDASSAPVQSVNAESPEDDEDEGAPQRLQLSGRSLLIFIGFLAASLAALY